MKIGIIGGGWAGVYFAYKIKKYFGSSHEIFILEKQSDIGGKCKNLLEKYPGGAGQFPNYKNFSTVLEDLKIKMVKKYDIDTGTYFLLDKITTLLKSFFYIIFLHKYENKSVEELYTQKELELFINPIGFNYGYKGITFHYLFLYLRSFVNLKTIFQFMQSYFLKKELSLFSYSLSDNIYELMKKMSKDINVLCDFKVTKINKIDQKYKLFSSKGDCHVFDVLIFTTPINETFSDIVPKEIIDECKDLMYNTYCSSALKKEEFDLLKKDAVFFINETDTKEYTFTYFYDKEKLKDIPEERKNILENYFPRFKNPRKSKKIINSFQGKDNIFYTGGYLSFELIESICTQVNEIIKLFHKQKI